MHPRKEDRYRWSVLPQKAHLFEKNLSKLSIGVYTQIIQGIGVFFEALPNEVWPVRQDSLERSENHQIQRDSSIEIARKPIEIEVPEANFTACIVQLKDEVAVLQEQVHQWQTSAESEGDRRRNLESQLKKAKSVFVALRKENSELRKENQNARKQSSQLKVKADAWDRDVRQLVAVTDRMVAISETPQLALTNEDVVFSEVLEI